MSQAITQGGGCLTLHSKWKSAFDDSEASDNETEKKGENLASPKHAKGAGGETGSGEQQVAATTRALELSRITENTSCKDEGKGESEKRQSLHIDIQLPLPANAKTSGSPEQSKGHPPEKNDFTWEFFPY